MYLKACCGWVLFHVVRLNPNSDGGECSILKSDSLARSRSASDISRLFGLRRFGSRFSAAPLATSRRKIDVSGIEVNGLRQDKTRRGERRACVD
jgi:hypothetical protein